MACIVWSYKGKRYLVPEGLAHNPPPEAFNTGAVDWTCQGQVQSNDYDSIITAEGFMVGNAVKKVASAVGFKQCLKCKGRQQRWNDKGLALQRKVKEFFL